MADPIVAYPFDPTGQANSNRIPAEPIIILPPGDRLFHYAVPTFAPFFEEGLVVKLKDLNGNIIPLTMGVDYYLGHKFMDASLATMHPIWGSITFLRRDIAGTLLVDYNTLGGMWTIDSATIAEILLNTYRNPRITSWEQVVERPVDFPVIDHKWNLDDMVGQKEILEVLQKFYTAYLASLDPDGEGGGAGVIAEHIANKQNPHEVTALQVGTYTMLQIDTKFAEYLTKSGVAADSQKLNGKSLAAIMQDVANVKLDRAVFADKAEEANIAVEARDSNKLGGKTLLEVEQYIAAASVANASKLENKSLAQITTDILKGKAADSALLDGKTLEQILALVQESTGDAVTLSGKTLEAIMNDVQGVKVRQAEQADRAGDADLLDGKSLGEILGTLGAVIPDLAKNSEKVYGYTFEALMQNILDSQFWSDSQLSWTDMYMIEGQLIQNPADGGTQDPAFTYGFLGEFPIPLTGANNDKFDPTAKRYSTALEVVFFFAGKTLRLRVIITIKDDQSMQLEYFADQSVSDAIQLGVRNVDSTIKSVDGTQTAKFTQVYLKFKTADALRRIGVFQYMKNDFVLDSPSEPSLWTSTYKVLDSVVWQAPASNGSGGAGQVEFDELAVGVNQLLQTPAV